MELTLKEKLALQIAVRLGLERLQAGIADPDERQKVQDEIRDALDKLTGKTTPRENISGSELPTNQPAKDTVEEEFDRLKNGGYNGEERGFFCKKLEETCKAFVKKAYNKSEPEDIIASSFACAKDIAISYIESNIIDELKEQVLAFANEAERFSTLFNAIGYTDILHEESERIENAKTILKLRKENIEQANSAILSLERDRNIIESKKISKESKQEEISKLFELDVMYRPDIGWICFHEGKPGTKENNYKNGNGFTHIREKRTAIIEFLKKNGQFDEKIIERSIDDIFKSMVETIATCINNSIYRSRGKIIFDNGKNKVVLSKEAPKKIRPLKENNSREFKFKKMKSKERIKKSPLLREYAPPKANEVWTVTSYELYDGFEEINDKMLVTETAGVTSVLGVNPSTDRQLSSTIRNIGGPQQYAAKQDGGCPPTVLRTAALGGAQTAVGATSPVSSTLPHDQTEGKENMKDGIMESAAGSRYSTIFAMLDRAQDVEDYLRVIDAAFGEPEEIKEFSVPTSA